MPGPELRRQPDDLFWVRLYPLYETVTVGSTGVRHHLIGMNLPTQTPDETCLKSKITILVLTEASPLLGCSQYSGH